VPGIVQQAFDEFARLTGRQYRLFEYRGAADAEDVVVIMGSGTGAVEEAVDELVRRGRRVGLVSVRLYRPFQAADLLAALGGDRVGTTVPVRVVRGGQVQELQVMIGERE